MKSAEMAFKPTINPLIWVSSLVWVSNKKNTEITYLTIENMTHCKILFSGFNEYKIGFRHEF